MITKYIAPFNLVVNKQDGGEKMCLVTERMNKCSVFL